ELLIRLAIYLEQKVVTVAFVAALATWPINADDAVVILCVREGFLRGEHRVVKYLLVDQIEAAVRGVVALVLVGTRADRSVVVGDHVKDAISRSVLISKANANDELGAVADETATEGLRGGGGRRQAR